jgi:hypothetical protein
LHHNLTRKELKSVLRWHAISPLRDTTLLSDMCVLGEWAIAVLDLSDYQNSEHAIWGTCDCRREVSVLALPHPDNNLRRIPMLAGIRGALFDHGPHGRVDTSNRRIFTLHIRLLG